MPDAPLYAPARHAELAGDAWSETAARAALASVVDSLERTCSGPERLWPVHPRDRDDDPHEPYRTLYMGAGGVIWALDRLARDDLIEPRLDLAALAAALPGDWRAAPEFTSLYPAPHPSLLMGEAGLLLLAERLAPGSEARRDALAACIEANERNPTRELLWGSPGTMLAAQAAAELTAEARFASLWRSSADWLLAEWRDEVWEQDMYGTRDHYLGPGHGFAGNVHALLRGRRWLADERVAEIERRAVEVLQRRAQRQGGCAQWPPELRPDPRPGQERTQWCHGAPGMVIALGAVLPTSPVVDELLAGGGELTWQAGPLAANAGLCHGTAGNGYAFLRLFERTGDERWLERAQAFAMHAAAQAAEERRALGHGRPTLFTGDAGVAAFLGACLTADARFPVLDG